MKIRISPALTLLAALLLGYALRVDQLGALGIWGDEAFSIAVGKLALPKIIEAGRDTHPPLFHVLLHFWMQLAGTSEFSARFLALIAGMLLVPATYVVARRLIGKPAAIIAALLIAVSPFAVTYSQEARMYSQAALLTTLSVYGFLRLQSDLRSAPGSRLRWRWQAIYMVATLGAMYSHYYVFFVIAAQNVYALWRLRARPRWLGWWIGTQVALAVLYLPWVFAQTGYLANKASARWDAWGLSGMQDVWVNTLIAFGGGVATPSNVKWLAYPLLVIVILGLVILARRTRWFSSPDRLFAPLYLLLPMLIAWAVGPIMPFFYERFLLPILPAYVILLAAGLGALAVSRASLPGCALSVLSVIVLIAAQAPALWNLHHNPDFAKSNYREIMAIITEKSRPGDALLLLNPEQDALYAYYGDKSLPAYWFPPRDGWDSPGNQRQMAKIAQNNLRVWLILFGNARDWDPANNLQNWLNEHAFRTYHADTIDGALELYILGDVQPAQAKSANYAGLIQLTGFGVSADSASPGGAIQIALSWKALKRMDKDYTIFTHIVDDQQHIVGQFDGQPSAGTHPTSKWVVGEKNIDRFAIQIDPSTLPGSYWLQVGWYDLATLDRLPILDAHGDSVGDAVVLLPIQVR